MSLDLTTVQHVQPPRGAEGERTTVRRGDVLVCITGALTGNTALVDTDLPVRAFVNQHVGLVRPNESVVARYLAFVLRSKVGQLQFKTGEYGGTKQGLGLDDVKSVLVPLPPRLEQLAICRDLDRKLGRVSTLEASLSREIALLREYRARLIADVVTGKLDVREAATRLPDETDEPEPLDDAEALGEAAEDGESGDLDAVPVEAEA